MKTGAILLCACCGCGFITDVRDAAKAWKQAGQNAQAATAEGKKAAKTVGAVIQEVAPYGAGALLAALAGWKGKRMYQKRRACQAERK